MGDWYFGPNHMAISRERCTLSRIGGEWFENCVEVKDEPINTDKGSVFGWFVCALASSSFTYGCDYDWYKDKCECKGNIIRPMWRK